MTHLNSPIWLVESDNFNPWRNLALENYLVTRVQADQPDAPSAILYLWQNDHTVVIGRHQNAWAECNVGLLEQEGGKLARRSTGGGAVYHDLGNLNFSLILAPDLFNIDEHFELIKQAVAKHGLSAEKSGRNDLLINGLKFSGNAFARHKNAGLHHGTLLVHSDYARIARYLTVNAAKLRAKGVASVRSRVTNLQALKEDLTIDDLKTSLTSVFVEKYRNGPAPARYHDQSFEHEKHFRELTEQFSSWSWRLGKTIDFDAEIEEKFEWGLVKLGFNVSKGLINKVTVFSDALDTAYIALLENVFIDTRFHAAELASKLEQTSFPPSDILTDRASMSADIAAWLRQQNW